MTDSLSSFFKNKASNRNLPFVATTVMSIKRGPIYFLITLLFSFLMSIFEGLGVFAFVPLLDLITNEKLSESSRIFSLISSFVVGETQTEQVVFIGLFIFLVSLSKAAFEYFSRAFSGILMASVSNELSKQALRAFLSINVSIAEGEEFGYLKNNILQMPGRISQILQHYITILVSSLLVVIYFSILIFTAPMMTALTIVFLLLLSCVSIILSKVQASLGETLTNKGQIVQQLVFETIAKIRLIRVLGTEGNVEANSIVGLNNRFEAIKKMNLTSALGAPIFTAVGGFLVSLILIVGVFFQFNDLAVWISTLLIFTIVLYRLLNPVSHINASRIAIAGHINAVEEYQNFLDLCFHNPQPTGEKKFLGLEDNITFEGVSKIYPGSKKAGLHDLNCKIEKGQYVAFVGPSGAGKTTFANLISYLDCPTTGNIFVDGIDLKEIEYSSWMERLGYVTQESIFFKGSVRKNLELAKPDASESALIKALEAADADQLENGTNGILDKVVGEHGSNLSGGEKQRLSLARVFLRTKDLLILDEPTSSLDSISGEKIRKFLSHQKGSKTMIVISHNLSFVRDADKIFVLSEGHIVETGSHYSLMKKKGYYYKMAKTQEFIAE